MWTIGEAADRVGLAVSALRYWDERGVVSPRGRQHGRRVYDEDELYRLAVAKLLQNTGLLSLEEISAVVHGPSVGEDWRGAVHARLAAIHDQQERLARAEAYLTHFATCPSENPVTTCHHLRRDIASLLGPSAS